MSTTKQDRIKKEISDEFDRLNDEINSLEDTKVDLSRELEDAACRISELKDLVEEKEFECLFFIDTGRDSGIRYSADNLLDRQIMEALSELIVSSNNVTLLQHLESLKKQGV